MTKRTRKNLMKGKHAASYAAGKKPKTPEVLVPTRATKVVRRPVRLKPLEEDFDYLGYKVPKGTLVPDVPLAELPGPDERTETNVAEVIALVLAGKLLPYPHNRGYGQAAKGTVKSIVKDGIHSTLGNMVFGYVNKAEHTWKSYGEEDPRWAEAHQSVAHGRTMGILTRMVNGDMTLAEWQYPFPLVPATDMLLAYKHDGLQGSAHTATHRAVNPDLALGHLRQQVLDLLSDDARRAVNKRQFIGGLRSVLLTASNGPFGSEQTTYSLYRNRNMEKNVAMERAGTVVISKPALKRIANAIEYWSEVRNEYLTHPCRNASSKVLMNTPGMFLYIIADLLCDHGNCHPTPEATAARLVQANGDTKLHDAAGNITRDVKVVALEAEEKIGRVFGAPVSRKFAADAKCLRRERAMRKKDAAAREKGRTEISDALDA